MALAHLHISHSITSEVTHSHTHSHLHIVKPSHHTHSHTHLTSSLTHTLTGSSDPYVKFKCGRFKYRSSVVHRNLNPEWNETFSFRTSNLKVPLEARVFDHDFGSLDDFMGGQSLDLAAYTSSE